MQRIIPQLFRDHQRRGGQKIFKTIGNGKQPQNSFPDSMEGEGGGAHINSQKCDSLMKTCVFRQNARTERADGPEFPNLSEATGNRWVLVELAFFKGTSPER